MSQFRSPSLGEYLPKGLIQALLACKPMSSAISRLVNMFFGLLQLWRELPSGACEFFMKSRQAKTAKPGVHGETAKKPWQVRMDLCDLAEIRCVFRNARLG